MMPHSWPSAITAAMTLASGGVLLLAAGHDVISRTVPNWMSLLIAIFGAVASFADDRLLISATLGVAVFFVAAIFWRRGLMGGADVKLLGAVAIVLPPGMVSSFVVAMSVAGATHAIAYLLARRIVTVPRQARPRPLWARALRAERWRISRGGPLPYACAIAFGFLFVLCNGGVP
jgi:prepilin peptidase CpaA